MAKVDNTKKYMFYLSLVCVCICFFNVFSSPDRSIMLYPVADRLSVCVFDGTKYIFSTNCQTNKEFNIRCVAVAVI